MVVKWIETPYGQISADFCVDRLSNLCDPNAGIQTGPFGSQLHQEDYVQIGTPIITVEHLGENRILHVNTPKVSDADRNRLSRYQLNQGDIVFSRVGSVDRRALVRAQEEGWLFSGRCLRVRPDSSKIDSQFLSYFFGLSAFKEHIRSIAVGATMPSLNTSLLSEIVVPHPPNIEEQRAIAHILGTLDDKIELNRKQNETLEAMARALFKAWFVDFEPVRAKMEGRWQRGQSLPGLPAHLYDLFPDRLVESELGEIPEGWTVARAGEIYDVGIGKTPPRKEAHWFSEDPKDLPWMSIKDLGRAGLYISEVSEYLTPDAVERFRVRRIPSDTVVLSFKLTVGRVAIADGEMLSNEAIAHFLPKAGNRLSTPYLYCYIRQFDYESLGSTSSIATAVNSDSVRSIPILVPDEPIGQAFEILANNSFAQIRSIQRESRSLARLRDTLLPKLISGELRVPDAERMVGAGV